jgi:hypothetical protein
VLWLDGRRDGEAETKVGVVDGYTVEGGTDGGIDSIVFVAVGTSVTAGVGGFVTGDTVVSVIVGDMVMHSAGSAAVVLVEIGDIVADSGNSSIVLGRGASGKL